MGRRTVGPVRPWCGGVAIIWEKYSKNDEYICWRFSGHFYCKLMEIISSKAPGNYSAPFWSYIFSICLWKNQKTIISMISGISDVSPSPQTNIIYLWRHQDILTTSRKSQIIFETSYVYKFRKFGYHFLKSLEKKDTDKSRRSVE